MKPISALFAVLTVLAAPVARASELKLDQALYDAAGLVAPTSQASDDDTELSLRPHVGPGGGTSYYSGGAASPEGRTLGIGLQLGYPTAITLKLMVAADQGIVFGLGVFGAYAYDAASISLHVDYLWHPHVLAVAQPFNLSWYIGGGLHVLAFTDNRQRFGYGGFGYFAGAQPIAIAARVPIGLDLAFNAIPFELYLEIAPELALFPAIGFAGIGAALGGRFYF